MGALAKQRLAMMAVIVGHQVLALGDAAAKEFTCSEVRQQPAITDDWQTTHIILLAHAVKNGADAGGKVFTELAVDHVFKSHDARSCA